MLIGYAAKARKGGIVSLEAEAANAPDPFLRKALNLAVDGTDLNVIRQIMELEITLEEHHGEAGSECRLCEWCESCGTRKQRSGDSSGSF